MNVHRRRPVDSSASNGRSAASTEGSVREPIAMALLVRRLVTSIARDMQVHVRRRRTIDDGQATAPTDADDFMPLPR
jgi:hypothetical protein